MYSGILQHSPAHITVRVLTAMALTVAHDSGDLWPAFAHNEPEAPDDCITVFDSAGRDPVHTMPQGHLAEHHGVQIRVRSRSSADGWSKAKAIQTALAESGVNRYATLDSTNYQVHCYSDIGNVIALGRAPDSNRWLFTINALAVIRQLN